MRFLFAPILAACLCIVLVIPGTIVTIASFPGTSERQIQLKDGRTVTCLATKGYTHSLSCDWANARKTRVSP